MNTPAHSFFKSAAEMTVIPIRLMRSTLILLGLCGLCSLGAEDRNLKVLPKDAGTRVANIGRVWPETPGDAVVSLWKDDKLGAVTVTIDDNQAGQIDWWVEQGEQTGFRFTWFIITDWVETRGIGGTWEQYRALVGQGHDVQSHTASHLSNPELDIADEYRISKAVIEENIPGHRVTALAYPGGGQSHRNDPKVAAETYLAARGTRAIINRINHTDYLSVDSASGTFVFHNPKHWADMGHLLGETNQKKLYQGWYCAHFHQVDEKARKHVTDAFDYLKAHEEDFWVGLFREVAMYGQQRDTAEVESKVMGPDQIALKLTDRMDDTIFDLPLTIKVRLPGNWRGVAATQNKEKIESRVVVHEGAPYALVQAVPDRGTIFLRPN